MTYSGNFLQGWIMQWAMLLQRTISPYAKAEENPILERSRHVTGTGHSCMFRTTDGTLMICYHGRTRAAAGTVSPFISRAFHVGRKADY